MNRRMVLVALTWFCAPLKARAEQFLWAPLESLTVNCDFCCRDYPIPGRCHGAIDFRARRPTPVFAAASGTVEIVVNRFANQPNREWGYGNRVMVQHANGYRTLYAHLTRESITVRRGDAVAAGEQIALSDNSGYSTGPHLHFEVRNPSGQKVNPYGDPPDYAGGCGPNALWATCPPQLHRDIDGDGYSVAEGDCLDEGATLEGVPASAIHPGASEVCNYADDNCDGTTDEGFEGVLTPCTITFGACSNTGTWVCLSDGSGLSCIAPPVGVPSPERCDGQDNDCNGVVDDGGAQEICRDDVYCNGEEACVGGVCAPGAPVECNDGVDCTLDLCWEPADTCSTVLDHAACEDGIPCTTNRCTPAGCDSTSFEHTACADDDPCTNDECIVSGCTNLIALDADEDGFIAAACPGGTDCDDDNAAIHPTALEMCDGVDQNCDGVRDNEPDASMSCSDTVGGSVGCEAGVCIPSCVFGYSACGEVCCTSWSAILVDGAPSARGIHTAVWTGSEMVVWGGAVSDTEFVNTGARYQPITGWSPIGIPPLEARIWHTAVWTGSSMIVWGGQSASAGFNTGGAYDPATDSWELIPTEDAPVARSRHTSVWTGAEMIVWGGWDGGARVNTGGRYNPMTMVWTPTTTVGAPAGRRFHTTIWTGEEMIVWGGSVTSGLTNTGGRYDPSSDTWILTSLVSAPTARTNHTAVWTGSEMIVWGGDSGSTYLATGGRYDPTTDSWIATPIPVAIEARLLHTAIWTGEEMIVWGGLALNGTFLNTGWWFNPSAVLYAEMTRMDAPTGRRYHTAVWTGSEMIVWGGNTAPGVLTGTGGRYTPP